MTQMRHGRASGKGGWANPSAMKGREDPPCRRDGGMAWRSCIHVSVYMLTP